MRNFVCCRLRALAVVSVVLCILGMMFIPMSVSAEPDNGIGRDTILIIDSSSSMRTDSDPERIAIEAATLYVGNNEMQDNNVAVISFGSKVRMSTGFMDGSTISSRDEINGLINKIEYTGYTDVGAAMKEAQQLAVEWSNSHPERAGKMMIILLSDGVTDISSSSDRTIEESDAERDEVVDYFAKNNVPIYTIGLCAGEEYNRKDLEAIAEKTGALYFNTADAADLLDIINEIFADSRGSSHNDEPVEFTSDGENYYSCVINIPNPSVLESNIMIRYGKQLKDVTLTDPSGNELDINNDASIAVTRSKTYTLIKIIRPQKGEWLFSVLGVKDDDISISLTNNFNLAATMEATRDLMTMTVHQTADVASTLETNAADIEIDDNTYEGLTCTAVIADADGNVLSKTPLNYDTANHCMRGTVTFDDPQAAQIWCSYDAYYISRQTEVAPITVYNSAPTHSGDAHSYTLFLHRDADKDNTLDGLIDHYKDLDGCPIVLVPVSYDDSVVEIEVNGSDVIARVVGKGSTKFNYEIMDDHGAAISDSITVRVVDSLPIVAIASGALLVVIALVALIVMRARNRRRGYWKGGMTVDISIQDGMNGNYSYEQLNMGQFGNRTLTVLEVLHTQRTHMPSEISQLLGAITISPDDGGNTMRIRWQRVKAETRHEEFSGAQLKCPINGEEATLTVRYI